MSLSQQVAMELSGLVFLSPYLPTVIDQQLKVLKIMYLVFEISNKQAFSYYQDKHKYMKKG